MMTRVEFEYLDLDGDGLPDAVRTIRTTASERVTELATGIDIDGEPAEVHVSSDVFAAA
jgi:hypothetical protein